MPSLSPRWRKGLRDLWSNKSRTILVVLAIAVGVFAFGSTFITREVISTDIDTQYRALNPSNIILNTDPFQDSLLRWAARQDGVIAVQGRAAYTVKLISGGQQYTLSLTAMDFENMPVNRITPEAGAWPPGRHEALFERASLPVAGASIGDDITIEAADGRSRQLTVVGTVHDLNAIPANLYPVLSAYVSFQTLEWLGYPAGYNQLHIVTPPGQTLTTLSTQADHLKVLLTSQGLGVGSVTVRETRKLWSQRYLDSMGLILTGMGLFSLLLSGFLVINTITALVTQQRRQIGMMKAVGGRAYQINSIYIAMMGFYGLLALCVALPVGILLSRFFTDFLSSYLNFDILNFHMSWQVFLLQVGVALIVPVLAGLLPVVGAVRTTVREALSTYGASGRREGMMQRALARLRGLPRPLLLSLRNTFRSPGRLWMTLTTLTIAGVLFITVVNMRASLAEELNREIQMWQYDVEVNLTGPYPAKQMQELVNTVPGVVKTEGRSAVSAQRITPDGLREASITVFGLDPVSASVNPNILSGRWLVSGDRNAVVIGNMVINDSPDIKVGDDLTFDMNGEKRLWTVVGIVSSLSGRIAYAPAQELDKYSGGRGMVSALFITTETKDAQSEANTAMAVEKILKDRGVGTSQWNTMATTISSNTASFDVLIFFLLFMAAMVAIIGGLGLASTLGINVMERTREIGVMRSVGASNATVSGIVLLEGLFIGCLSWLLAVPLSIPASNLFGTILGNAFFLRPMAAVYSLSNAAIWLGIVLVISLVSSLLPARRASKLSIRETLAYE